MTTVKKTNNTKWHFGLKYTQDIESQYINSDDSYIICCKVVYGSKRRYTSYWQLILSCIFHLYIQEEKNRIALLCFSV